MTVSDCRDAPPKRPQASEGYITPAPSRVAEVGASERVRAGDQGQQTNAADSRPPDPPIRPAGHRPPPSVNCPVSTHWLTGALAPATPANVPDLADAPLPVLARYAPCGPGQLAVGHRRPGPRVRYVWDRLRRLQACAGHSWRRSTAARRLECSSAVCKTVGLAYVGSNPTPATNYSPQYQQVSAVIRNLVPVSTASRSERSANRSLYQGNCARAGFSLPVQPFHADQYCVRLCHVDLREIPPDRHRLHVRADGAGHRIFDRGFDRSIDHGHIADRIWAKQAVRRTACCRGR